MKHDHIKYPQAHWHNAKKCLAILVAYATAVILLTWVLHTRAEHHSPRNERGACMLPADRQ